jgi:hypothetical protein
MKRSLVFVFVLALVMSVAVFGFAATPPKTPNLTLPPFQIPGQFGVPKMHTTALNGLNGDDNNAYAWSMVAFKGHVYVGTGRLVDTFQPMWEAVWQGIAPGTTPARLPGVPFQPFMSEWLKQTGGSAVVTDVAKFNLWNAESRAEIYRYDGDRAWARVFRSNWVPSLLSDTNGNHPFKASEVCGFRSMVVYTDKSGTEALYATSGGLNFAAPGYGPKILRTVDGTQWERLLTPSAMGSETRATAVHHGKLYVGASVSNIGSMWVSDAPTNTASWKKVIDFNDVDKTNSVVISIASFNGKVFVGTQNITGFQLWRSKVSDPTTSTDFVKVMDAGGGDRYNVWAGTLKVFNGKLYVGSMSLPYLSGTPAMKGFDIFRVSTDDKWQLLVGNKTPTKPVTADATRTAISGWPSGFGNPLNLYQWSMEVHKGRLYAGTFDASVFLTYLKEYGTPDGITLPPGADTLINLSPYTAGADLWSTSDGVYWFPHTINGFGDTHNYGFRTLLSYNDRLWAGLNNPFDGCEVWHTDIMR